jgi:nitronate monooxygenase
MNWPDRRILDLLKIEHPILQAPMAGATNADLVAAVSAAGGLGGYGAAGTAPGQLAEVVRAVRQRTDRPFQVNLFAPSTEQSDTNAVAGPHVALRIQSWHLELGLGQLPAPNRPFGPAFEQLEVLLEEGVPVVSLHFGLDPELVRRAQEAGATLLCTATTVQEAKLLAGLGVDAIIAQGTEAGGHRGTFASHHHQALIGTLALVPAIVDAVEVPVIAAGGIMDARGLVAALALGASAVQMGTAFLGCSEAPVHEAWRAALETSSASDTEVTEAISGKPARGLSNRLIRELDAARAADYAAGTPPLPYPAHYSLTRQVRQAAAARGDGELMAMWSGQGLDLFKRTSAAQLIAELASESAALRRALAVGV